MISQNITLNPLVSLQVVARFTRAFAADAKSLDELRKPKFSSKYLIQHVSQKLIPAVKEWEKQYQPPVIHLGRVLSVGDGIARVYGLKSVQVGHCSGQALCAIANTPR